MIKLPMQHSGVGIGEFSWNHNPGRFIVLEWLGFVCVAGFLCGVLLLSRRAAALLRSALDLWISFQIATDRAGISGSALEITTLPKNVKSGDSESLHIVQPGVVQSTGFLELKSTSWRIGEDSLADMCTTLILSAEI